MLGTLSGTVILFISSIFDCRDRRIPVVLLAIGGVWAVVLFLFTVPEQGVGTALLTAVLSVLPGVGLLLLSFLTEKKVGAGDGMLLIVLGILQGGEKVLFLFCVGLFIQSLFAVVLLLLHRAHKETRIAFAPFLLLAELLLMTERIL